ncbi:hypothetical protein K456DRAFT_1805677, partial [Colletotrichum gloeosporioides 23]
VDEDTVSRIIRKLPSRKAAGPDGVPSDVLKMTLDVILPYLVHLFKAYINLNHHPECFKESYTVVLKKEGKDNCTLPKSYQPIALLSCVGKALERLVADDLQRLALKYGLIPPTQYG